MKKIITYPLLVLIAALFLGCPSDEDDDCLKTITIPQFYIVNNQTFSYDIKMEVPCDFEEPSQATQIEPPLLKNFSYEVLNFKYTPDTGNNTSRLQFEIKLINSNSFAAEGVPVLTINYDGLEVSSNFEINTCGKLNANSSCIVSFDKQDSLDLGSVKTVNLVTVKYYLKN